MPFFLCILLRSAIISRYRNAKPFKGAWQIATGLAGGIHELPRHSRVAEANRWRDFTIGVNKPNNNPSYHIFIARISGFKT